MPGRPLKLKMQRLLPGKNCPVKRQTQLPMCPPLEPGHVYAWCVRVVAKDGIDDVRVFENDGLSVIRTFRIGTGGKTPQLR